MEAAERPRQVGHARRVADLGTLRRHVGDRTALPDATGVPTEATHGRYVETRRSASADQVLDDYATVSAKALDALADLETLYFELPLGDLGTYHVPLLPTPPPSTTTPTPARPVRATGPLDGVPPPSDAPRLVPTIDWIVAAVPQQNAELLAPLDGAIAVDITGTAPRPFTIGAGDVPATVACTVHHLGLWSTEPATWDDLGPTAIGDVAAVAAARHLPIF